MFPGLMLSALIALSVAFISDRLGGPAMLYALLIGMSFNFLSIDERFEKGVQVASRNILRFGVALLGARITTGDVIGLGWPVIGLIVGGVVATIVVGQQIGRGCKLGKEHALLSAGAVAICGASATLAIASVLPPHKDHERNTVMTVASVTALSTLAMVVYPILVTFLHFDNTTAGIFLGATIHDVAQVVGAGYMVSPETGEISTLVKLMRVACLVPVVLTISFALRRRQIAGARKVPLLPGFLLSFVLIVIANSNGWLPAGLREVLTPVSNWCLLTAVAALGVKTSLKALLEVGPWPIAAMVLQTVFLAFFAITGLLILA